MALILNNPQRLICHKTKRKEIKSIIFLCLNSLFPETATIPMELSSMEFSSTEFSSIEFSSMEFETDFLCLAIFKKKSLKKNHAERYQFQSIYLSIYLSISICSYLSIYLSIYLNLFMFISFHPANIYVCLYLFHWPSTYLSIYLYIYLSRNITKKKRIERITTKRLFRDKLNEFSKRSTAPD